MLSSGGLQDGSLQGQSLRGLLLVVRRVGLQALLGQQLPPGLQSLTPGTASTFETSFMVTRFTFYWGRKGDREEHRLYSLGLEVSCRHTPSHLVAQGACGKHRELLNRAKRLLTEVAEGKYISFVFSLICPLHTRHQPSPSQVRHFWSSKGKMMSSSF